MMGGAKALGGLFGGGSSERTMSPQAKQLYARLQGLLDKGLPQDMIAQIAAPYIQQKKRIEQHYKRQPGSSGIKHAVIQRQATTPQAQAIAGAGRRYEMGLLGQMAGLTAGTGKVSQGTNWGNIVGDVGGGFAGAYGEDQEWGQMMDFFRKMGLMDGGGGFG
jgi:hypothetical protein